TRCLSRSSAICRPGWPCCPSAIRRSSTSFARQIGGAPRRWYPSTGSRPPRSSSSCWTRPRPRRTMEPATMDDQELCYTDIATFGRRYPPRALSPVEATRAVLDRIGRLDGRLNSFITVLEGPALEQARQAEAELAQGNDRGPLHGVPISLKDLIDTAGVRT